MMNTANSIWLSSHFSLGQIAKLFRNCIFEILPVHFFDNIVETGWNVILDVNSFQPILVGLMLEIVININEVAQNRAGKQAEDSARQKEEI